MDFIGKFENLQEDFNKVCDKIGVKRERLPHRKKSIRKPYRDYYNSNTKKIVENLYGEDIEHFGYRF